MKKTIIFILIIVIGAIAALAYEIHERRGSSRDELVLYGNVDLRQVNLAFNGNERIQSILVREGDRVKKGQVLGTLQKERLKASVDEARARVEAQREVVARLERGSRPEEIDQARANVDSAKADLTNARLLYERASKTSVSGATSGQDRDSAKAAFEMAEGRLRVNQKALELAVKGPRQEDKAQARATLRADEANLALLGQDLAYATLVSPTDGVVQNRILEPGEMASPQRPVLDIAITNPKWVRVYVSEPDLGKLHQGMKAQVSTDSFPGKVYNGWVGFISPSASFTPKSVETTDLRTSLVYEVRVFVTDPRDELRLGMPATVVAAWRRSGGGTASRD
ncbi:MAG: HlyD family efflux transporter periplasmic adaptor subunit [Syntrophobacteraceae bacterium]|nr:HlyD family efflux transporter periplasmic adaptor subunit [Syntrophobacteraceae bacterium]